MTVTAPRGFAASGIACGIKESGETDLALIATAGCKPVPAAAVFTTNKAAAAPVRVSKAHLEATGGMSTAVVLNSGNANAATGMPGREHAWRTAQMVGHALGADPHQVLVCSTGLIGIPLPFPKIESGIASLVEGLGGAEEDGHRAARAIMTTDTRPKEIVVEGAGFTVGGMAKGAAMLEPSMATMLAVLTTDAECSPEELSAALVDAVESSFNQMVVDGSTSTNDTVIVLAGGASGTRATRADLAEPLRHACDRLAYQMAADAEGGTKVARITVTGAASIEDARRGARQVASSLLVKCSLHGEDPYWGRIVSELGSAGIAFDIDRVAVSYGGVVVCAGGVAHSHDGQAVAAHLAGHDLEIVADLGIGSATGSMYATDISHAYIDENVRTS